MTTSNSPAAGGARPAARAAIVPVKIETDVIPLSRLAPASCMSVAFHLFLLAAFALLAPRSQADGPMETKDDAVVQTESSDNSNRPTFDSPDVSSDDVLNGGGDLGSNSANKDILDIPDLGLGGGPLGTPFGKESDPLQGVATPFSPLNRPGLPRSVDGPDGIAVPDGKPGGSDVMSRAFLRGPLGRQGAARDAVGKGFANPASQAAVHKGLNWLARVQSPAGVWKLDGNFPDKGNANDVAGTALGLLPFLGAGKTHKSTNDKTPAGIAHIQAIDKAIQYLVAVQDKKSGAFSRDMYAHGLAAIAISEAFALSQDYNLRKPAQSAINFIVSAQHAGGGWRYNPGQAGDMSVSGWQIMALKSGVMAGLDVPPSSLRLAQSFLDHVVDVQTEGSGYTDPQPTPTMTSVALLCRQYLNGWGPQNLRLIKGVDNYIKPNPPRPERKDVYYYYYATQVMHNLGGDDWKAWNVKMREQLVASQDNDPRDVARFGSWSPAGDQWGQAGGRLMVTSLNLLTLEVYYRYLPLYHREAK